MGILNVTPDSFSDGGKFADTQAAVARAETMLVAGAGLIDVGGESTRPGATPVSLEEELSRVLPVIKAIGEQLPSRPVLSIDTTKAAVAEQAMAAGAQIINDISGLRFDARMVDVAAETGAGLILMHMQGNPATMQQNPTYNDVVGEIRDFLEERIGFAESRGVKKTQIAVDPGIGFGKTVEHNLQLLAELEQFERLGCPIVIGASRKSFISKVLGTETADRLAGSLTVAGWAIAHGASIIRSHDVAETVAAVKLADELKRRRSGK